MVDLEEFQRIAADRMSEDDLLVNVLELARAMHVRTLHIRPARTKDGGWRTPVSGDGKGWPDLVLVGGRGVMYRECKTQAGSLDAHQRAWLEALDVAGENVKVWRPADLLDGTIRRELEVIAP